MLTFRQDTPASLLQDLFQGYTSIHCSPAVTVPPPHGQRCRCLGIVPVEDVHGTLTPRGVDKLVSVARVLPDLLDSPRTAALQSDGDLRLALTPVNPSDKEIGNVRTGISPDL